MSDIFNVDPPLKIKKNGIESMDIRIKTENFKCYDYTTTKNIRHLDISCCKKFSQNLTRVDQVWFILHRCWGQWCSDP